MARYYRRYTKTIVKRAKKSWNVQRDSLSSSWTTVTGTNFSFSASIVINATDSNVPSPVVLKCKNAKAWMQLTIASQQQVAGGPTPVFFMVYFIFVPQIVYDSAPSSGTPAQAYTYWHKLIEDHPEWVMSQKAVNNKYQGGVPGEKAITQFSFSSGKMKRNLRSGDRIMFIGLGAINAATFNAEVQIEGLTQINVCNN